MYRQVIDVNLIDDSPEGTESDDRRGVCHSEHIHVADFGALQLAFIPGARGGLVKRRPLDLEDRVEIGSCAQSFDDDCRVAAGGIVCQRLLLE
jgi:hypothetical protein